MPSLRVNGIPGARLVVDRCGEVRASEVQQLREMYLRLEERVRALESRQKENLNSPINTTHNGTHT